MRILYSILMPYIRREVPFRNTLLTLTQHYGDRHDWEVVVVEDPKNFADPVAHSTLLSILEDFGNVSTTYRNLSAEPRTIWNPAKAYNLAAVFARGDYYVITSPEVLHVVDILHGLDEEFAQNPSVYVVCASRHVSLPRRISALSDISASPIMWYQHSEHRNLQYHFCSAISKENWQLLGGFDEDFSYACGYEDDDFITRVRKKSIIVHTRDDLLTFHQDHGGCPSLSGPSNGALYLQKHPSS